MPHPFTGREAEADLLVRRLGGRGLVVVEGEAGSGKTRLVAEALARAGRGLRTLRGAGGESGRRPPFGALGRVLGTPPGDAHRRRHLLDDVLADGPLAVVLEDVQWVGPAWLDAVPRLARVLAGRPVLLVLTVRPVHRGAAVERMRAALDGLGATAVPLCGLGPDAAATLARAVAPGTDPRRAPSHRPRDDGGGRPRLIGAAPMRAPTRWT